MAAIDNRHTLRWYEWNLPVFCKQASLHLAAIGTFTHSHTMTSFDAPWKQAFENIVGKGENAGNQYFLLFPLCFLLYQRQKFHFCYLTCRL